MSGFVWARVTGRFGGLSMVWRVKRDSRTSSIGMQSKKIWTFYKERHNRVLARLLWQFSKNIRGTVSVAM